MSREDRRRFAKSINTPKKLEQYENEIKSYYKQEYNDKVNKFIKSFTMLMAFVLDHELEKEEIIKLTARKSKNMNDKLGIAVAKITDSVLEHLQDVKTGYINLDDIEKFFKEERNVEWKW